MSYKILPTKEFARDFNKLDGFFKSRIKKKMNEVAENPERYKHLHYDLSGSCRIRIGKKDNELIIFLMGGEILLRDHGVSDIKWVKPKDFPREEECLPGTIELLRKYKSSI